MPKKYLFLTVRAIETKKGLNVKTLININTLYFTLQIFLRICEVYKMKGALNYIILNGFPYFSLVLILNLLPSLETFFNYKPPLKYSHSNSLFIVKFGPC